MILVITVATPMKKLVGAHLVGIGFPVCYVRYSCPIFYLYMNDTKGVFFHGEITFRKINSWNRQKFNQLKRKSTSVVWFKMIIFRGVPKEIL